MGEQLQERTAARPRVLLLCSPCMGHLIRFTELARRLVSDHGLAATILFAAAASPPSEQYLALAGVDLVALPAPPAPSSQTCAHAVRASVPRVREAVRSLPSVAALVLDMVGAVARGVASRYTCSSPRRG
jgi:hydroquinone glucosyltransferase